MAHQDKVAIIDAVTRGERLIQEELLDRIKHADSICLERAKIISDKNENIYALEQQKAELEKAWLDAESHTIRLERKIAELVEIHSGFGFSLANMSAECQEKDARIRQLEGKIEAYESRDECERCGYEICDCGGD
jgi:chromosome segregation ATPase